MRVKEEYVFEPDKDFLMRYTATDECFYATAEWSEKVGLFKRTVWKTATYRYDYQTKTLTELELEEFNVGISQATRTKNREYEAVLDGITYYLEEEEALGMMGGIAWVYRFAREKDGQTEYLQFWTSERKGTYPEKTDREFWRNAGETGEFKVLPY